MLRAACLLLCLLTAPQARAHPHVFVDVTLRFQADADGRLDAVEITWAYDELFSLLLLSERGLDADVDGALTEAEKAALQGFDLTGWPDWFQGATFAFRGDDPLALEAPEPLGVALRDGRVVTRHLRRFAATDPARLTVLPFDPSYYAALSLVAVEGLAPGCNAGIARPDKDEAEAQVALKSGATGEALFEEVRVGIYYADKLTIACD